MSDGRIVFDDGATKNQRVDSTHGLPVTQVPGTPITTSKYTQAAISAAASGDNTLIAGTAGQTIRVFRILYTLAAGTVTFKDGASNLTGALGGAGPSGLVLESTDGNPLFVTTDAAAFIANLSGANQLSGAIWYKKGAP